MNASPQSYRPINRRARLARLTLAMSGMAAFSTLIINWHVLTLLAEARAGKVLKRELDQADSVATLLAIFSILIAIGAAGMFCAWLYRVLTNLQALGHEEARYSPGYAVFAFFVPVLNLFVPIRAMRDAWNLPIAAEAPELPRYLGVWWATWIACNVLSWTSAVLGLRGDYENGLAIGTAGDALTIVAAVLAIRMVGGLTRRCDSGRFAVSPERRDGPKAEFARI